VFAGEALDTLQLNYEHVLDEDVRKVLTYRLTFVSDYKGNLRDSADTAKAEFSEQSTCLPIRVYWRSSAAQMLFTS
jgi:hypothetical protein